MENKMRELTGQRFNSLSVMWPCGYDERRKIIWFCLCDCGKFYYAQTQDIVRGKTKSCGCKKFNPEVGMQNLYCQYQYKAKSRGYEWNISFENFKNLVSSPCHYTGRSPAQVFKIKNKSGNVIVYNGLDRVDNAKGYLLDNVVPCCGAVNKAKLEMTQNEFITMCQQIAEKHPSKN